MGVVISHAELASLCPIVMLNQLIRDYCIETAGFIKPLWCRLFF